MKKTIPAACLSLLALFACVAALGLTLLAIVAIVGVQFFVTLLDEVTASTNIPADSPAFYQDPGGWDFRRIPLIAPYQALSIDNKTWYVALKTEPVRYHYSVGAVVGIAVIDKKFIVLHSALPANDEASKESWFIIVPAENHEEVFADEETFLNYLTTAGTPAPQWVNPEQLYSTFVDKGYLEWFPEEFQKK